MINIRKSLDVVVISGATASGKSNFGITLAQKAGQAVIINADSAQIYSNVPILANIPSMAEQQGIPHKLFALQPLTDYFSVMMWLELVKKEITNAQKAGLLPIIVGGSAMYILSLFEGLSPIPSSLPARKQAIELYEQLGHQEFLNLVTSIDATFTMQFQDKQRLIRAYEIFLCSNKPFSSWQKQPKEKIITANFVHLYLHLPRDLLYAKIDQRFNTMLAQGAIEEAQQVLQTTDSPEHLKKILGLYDLSLYLNSKISLTEAIAASQQKSRNYAKRQITFLQNKISNKIILEIENNVSNIPLNILE